MKLRSLNEISPQELQELVMSARVTLKVAMEPLSVAAAIAGIISAIKGFIDATATRQWQENVSGKLDLIIVQNSTILSELEQLPLLFAANLQAAFNAEVVIQATSLNNAFDQYMSGSTPDILQIKSIRTQAEVLANNIIQRGPCVYEAANAITALVLAIHKILHVDQVETQSLVNAVLAQMNTWAGDGNGMFGKAIADTSTLLESARATLAQEPRGTVVLFSDYVEYTPPSPGGGRHPHMRVILHVVADVAIDDNNLTFSLTNARSTWFDIVRFDDNVVSSHASSWSNRIQSEINMIKQLKDRLNILQTHENALQQMIVAIQNWR